MTKYRIEYTSKFKKSYKKLISQKGYNESDFKKVLEMLSTDKILPEKYRNHLLEPKSSRIMGMSYKAWLAINI